MTQLVSKSKCIRQERFKFSFIKDLVSHVRIALILANWEITNQHYYGSIYYLTRHKRKTLIGKETLR